MEIIPQILPGRQVIQSYSESGFRISGRLIVGSVLVFPDRTVPWPVRRPEDITLALLAPVLEAQPKVEILLLGCGQRQVMASSELREEMRRAAVSLDAMDTGAACRTYNLLLAEDRRVAAALIALGPEA